MAVTKRLWSEEKGPKGKGSDQLLDNLLENLGAATGLTSGSGLGGSLSKPSGVRLPDGGNGSDKVAAKLSSLVASSGMGLGGGGGASGKGGFGVIGIDTGVGNGKGGVNNTGTEGGTKRNRWVAGIVDQV